MIGEVLGQLEAGELVGGDHPVHHPAGLQDREVPVGRALGQTAVLHDLRRGERALGGHQNLHQSTSARGVALIGITQPGTHQSLKSVSHSGHPTERACDDGSMATPADPDLLQTAVTFLREAGEFTLQHFRRADLAIDSKGDGTPVTVADRGAERLLRELIEAKYPDDGILGEEEAEKLGTSGRRWIIDPIDGTKAFTHGVPLYSNLLAIEDAEGIQIGVINIPALGETVYAGRGLGCFANGEPCSVNDNQGVAGAYMTTSGFDPWDPQQIVAVKEAQLHLRTWGDGYGYVLVATGRLEAMFDPKAELYDLAPMPVILAEAGGRFSDLSGRFSPDGGSGLATNGQIHDELLELLSR